MRLPFDGAIGLCYDHEQPNLVLMDGEVTEYADHQALPEP